MKLMACGFHTIEELWTLGVPILSESLNHGSDFLFLCPTSVESECDVVIIWVIVVAHCGTFRPNTFWE